MIPPRIIASSDYDFETTIRSVANGIAALAEPKEFYCVHISGWFDDLWLRFAGKKEGIIPQHKWRLTVPPFVPGRVISEVKLIKASNSTEYEVEEDAAPIHIEQPSEANLENYLDTRYPDASFLWYSEPGENDERASVMAYIRTEKLRHAWFVSLTKRGIWKYHKGIWIYQVEFDLLRKKGETLLEAADAVVK